MKKKEKNVGFRLEYCVYQVAAVRGNERQLVKNKIKTKTTITTITTTLAFTSTATLVATTTTVTLTINT